MTDLLWWLTGTVVGGDGRGVELGFPTANLDIAVDSANSGVYAAWARIDGEESWRPATVSIGSNPTFWPRPPAARAEVHLHEYDGDLYGAVLQVALVRCLRRMETCASVTELIERSRNDVAASQRVLKTPPGLTGGAN